MMRVHRCAVQCAGCHQVSRRQFVAVGSASIASAVLPANWLAAGPSAATEKIRPKGPAAAYVPSLRACFVRREGEYGMAWPGAVYDGEAARQKYSQQIAAAAKELGLGLDLRAKPVHTEEEADAWLAEAAAARPDGLLVVLLDRKRPAWPIAVKAIDSQIPTVIFSPLGSSFTTNTEGPSKRTGCFICSTDDFRQVRYGMKMLWAGAKMRKTRCLVIRGAKRFDATMPHLGIELRHVPAQIFLDEYSKLAETDEILAMAKDLMDRARGQFGATRQDVINGIKSYVVARTLLEREQTDAITMDCLGALGQSKVSLPCIAWSKMNDDGIPAACEADLGAVATHAIVQYLFDRPGFQQDPVAETAREAVIGAHCCCPTRLNGFRTAPEPYDIVHHHGMRDATARPVWRVGQRVTLADVLPGSQDTPTKMVIAAGTVLDNVSVPPAGGCVVSVMVKFDGDTEVLQFPGFHQLFFYGDFKRQLTQFCRLFQIEPVLV
jgi:hypothetical protein